MGYFWFSHVYNQQQRKLEREEEKGCVCDFRECAQCRLCPLVTHSC